MKFTAFIFLLSFGLSAAAQETKPKYDFLESEKIIKLDMFSLFNMTPTLGVEVESIVNEQVSLQFGLGIIPSFFQPLVGNDLNTEFNIAFNNNNANGFDALRGYRLSAQSRFYVFRKPTRYISTSVSFRHIIVRDRDVRVGMEPFEGSNGLTEFAYFKSADMRFHQFRTALDLKYGFQRNMGDHFVLDFSAGLRLGTTNVQSRSDIPENGTLTPNWNNRMILVDNYRSSRVTPILGLKIGYRL